MKKNIIILISLLLPLIGITQQSAELTVAVGATITDIESLVEEDEIEGSFATDWGTFSIGGSGQFFFMKKDKFVIGGELMYHHLYWYSVSVPYGTQTIYRDYSVSAFRITPILRYEINNSAALDIGPEFNFVNGLKLGLMLSANYYIPITEMIDIPVKARFDVFNYIVPAVPISLNAGIRIKL
jgi:hypothetical protein